MPDACVSACILHLLAIGQGGRTFGVDAQVSFKRGRVFIAHADPQSLTSNFHHAPNSVERSTCVVYMLAYYERASVF